MRLLVAAGAQDDVAPPDVGTKLLEACIASGATARPLHKYEGAHEVTMETVGEVSQLLSGLLDGGAVAVD